MCVCMHVKSKKYLSKLLVLSQYGCSILLLYSSNMGIFTTLNLMNDDYDITVRVSALN